MKKIKEMIKELRTKSYGNAVLFFGFYLAFFAVLFLIFKFSPKTGKLYEKYETGTVVNYTFLNNNYHYNFTVTLDGTNYVYSGDRYNSYELFNYDNKNYFKDTDKFYVNNGKWEKVDNPYKFGKLLENGSVKTVISAAYLESNTTYNNGSNVYNFLISSDIISRVVDSKELDIEEIPNKIVVETDESKRIKKVTFNLNSYCKIIDSCKDNLKIELEYSKYGEIKEITNPIN